MSKVIINEEFKDFARNHTIKEIAQKYDIHYGYASQLCRKYEIKPKKTKYQTIAVDVEKLREYAKTHTLIECSKFFNVQYNLITCYVRNYSIVCLRNKIKGSNCKNGSCKRTGEARDMIVFLSQRFTISSIARTFGYSKERIRQILLEEVKE